ncbi:hypothetical protein [Lysinibacillus sp. RC79]|uniref:hypothetical protein n=1 Tax=Lysinibacillus sp. RC79 TaxID=3156296 RepID=UPI003516C655
MIKNLFWAIVFQVVAVNLSYDIYLLWAYNICFGKFNQTMLGLFFVIGLAINGFSSLARIFESLKEGTSDE